MITEPKDLLETSLSPAIDTAVECLMCDQAWIDKPSPTQMFCLKFVNACCTRIFMFCKRFASVESVDWVKFNTPFSVITKVGSPYCSYAKSRQEEINLSDALPATVDENPAALVYFKWVQRIHSMLARWKSRLQDKQASYEEIDWYCQYQEKIHKLANAIGAAKLIVSNVSDLKDTFLHFYMLLNQLILKYISGDLKAGW